MPRIPQPVAPRGSDGRFLPGERMSLAQRFWRRVDTSGGLEACWPFLGARTRAGYGVLGQPDGGQVYAHRLALELADGPLAEGQCALHRCDNPPCCNPLHLFAGSRAENNRDMVAKGRHWSQRAVPA